MTNREQVRRMTSKGQVTVPKQMRERLQLQPGSLVRFSLGAEGEVIISRAAPSLEEAYGAVAPLRRPEDFEKLRDEAIEERVMSKFGREQGQ